MKHLFLIFFIFFHIGCFLDIQSPPRDQGKSSLDEVNEFISILTFPSINWKAHLFYPEKVESEKQLSFELFFFKIIDNDSSSLEEDCNYTVKAHLWMDMGPHSHGSLPIDQLILVEKNRYQLYPVFFSMTGEWELHIEIWQEQTKIDENIHKIFIK